MLAWQDRGRPLVAVRDPAAAAFGTPVAVPTSGPGGLASHMSSVPAVTAGGRAVLAATTGGGVVDNPQTPVELADRAAGGAWSVSQRIASVPTAMGTLIGAALGPAGEAVVVVRGTSATGASELWATARSADGSPRPAQRLSTLGALLAVGVALAVSAPATAQTTGNETSRVSS